MYAPMLAGSLVGMDIRKYLEDSRWVIQQKFDGNRILIVWRPGAKPQFLNRNGSPYAKRVPTALREMACPWGDGTQTAILDGELVGKLFHAFDLLVVENGSDPTPYAERRERLVSACKPNASHMRLAPEAVTLEQKVLFVEQAIQRRVEGLILKRVDSGYHFGRRSNDWLKVKFDRTADVIIKSVRANGKESAEMVVRDGNRVVPVGEVSLLGKEKRGRIEPGMVCEVKYLYCTEKNILFQPRILRVRDDKHPLECTIDQLQYTDKEALIR